MRKIFHKIQKSFTVWYINCHYGIIGVPGSPLFSFLCPKWVKFFAQWLFSYDTYISELRKKGGK